MASKIFLLLALAFAVVLLASSQIAAAKDLDAGKVEDVKYYGSGGYYNGGGRGGYYNGGGRGGYFNGGGRGGYNNGGGGARGYCSYGCCGSSGYAPIGECRCCSTLAEATAYKQAHQAQTHY